MRKIAVQPRVLGACAIAAAALGVAGCGASVAGPSRPVASTSKVGTSAISRAADVSGAAQGEQVAYTLTETLPKLGAVKLTGTGTFNNSPADGEMDMQVSVPGASGLGAMAASILSNLKLDFVFDGSDVYLQVPSSLSSLTSTVTQGKPWVSLDLAKLASESKIPGLSSVLAGGTGDSASMDPTQALSMLKAASSDGVTKVGSATINGVATTEYQGDIDLAKLTSRLPASLRALMKQRLAGARQRLSGADKARLTRALKQAQAVQIPFTVDIDADNLVRQITASFTHTTASGTKLPATLTLDFLSYGPQAAPTIPAASQTADLDSLVSSWAKKIASGNVVGGGLPDGGFESGNIFGG